MTQWLIDVMATNAQGAQTQSIREQWISSSLESRRDAIQAWVALVRTGAVWDLKENLGQPGQFIDGERMIVLGGKSVHLDALANIHFGFVGRAAGFWPGILKTGAGVAQLIRRIETDDPREMGNCVTSYCDHPYATWAIGFGVYLHFLYGDNLDGLTKDAFASALDDYTEANPMPEPPPFP